MLEICFGKCLKENQKSLQCFFQVLVSKNECENANFLGAKHDGKYIFLTIQFMGCSSFLKDDQCSFRLIKDENRMKFDHKFLAFLATYQKQLPIKTAQGSRSI